MKRVTIHLGNIEAVKKFVNIVCKFEPEMDLLSGRYTIDAKSIMGILSLDLTEPIKMIIHSEACDDLLEAIGEFLIEE